MKLFCSDLDNTLIYSYKHDIGADKLCVEIYQGREVSFMTGQSRDLLKKVNDNFIFVPTTTRTMEQYRRIDLGIGIPHYALVCNGGILLVDGEEDREWYKISVEMIKDCQAELQKAEEFLQADEHRCFEVRNIRELFIFTKSNEPEKTMDGLEDILDLSLVNVLSNGIKVYVVPKKLSKGIAVQRLKERTGAELTIAAGDSTFDISMLLSADMGIAPLDLKMSGISREEEKKIIRAESGKVYSDWMLDYILENTIMLNT